MTIYSGGPIIVIVIINDWIYERNREKKKKKKTRGLMNIQSSVVINNKQMRQVIPRYLTEVDQWSGSSVGIIIGTVKRTHWYTSRRRMGANEKYMVVRRPPASN